MTRAGRALAPERRALSSGSESRRHRCGRGHRPAFSAGCPGSAGAERPLGWLFRGPGTSEGRREPGRFWDPDGALRGARDRRPGREEGCPHRRGRGSPGTEGRGAGGRDVGRGQLRPGLGARASAGAPWASVAGASRPIPPGTSGGRATGWGLGLTGSFYDGVLTTRTEPSVRLCPPPFYFVSKAR